jgi:hypothetical protein
MQYCVRATLLSGMSNIKSIKTTINFFCVAAETFGIGAIVGGLGCFAGSYVIKKGCEKILSSDLDQYPLLFFFPSL